jgi:phosphoribosylformimino-5-aminoimidazole carboxamide ribotide isomerase
MLLVIPRIDIRDGTCEYAPTAVGRHLLRDPVAMSKLWRVQNAKTIVLVDLPSRDGLRLEQLDPANPSLNLAAIAAVCDQLDIPIQVDCSRNPAAEIEMLLACNAYRLILADNTDLSRFTALSAGGRSRRFAIRMNLEPAEVSAQKIRDFVAAGCSRFVVNVLPASTTLVDAFSTLERHARELPLAKFSIDGGVTDYPSLRAVADAAPANVDSVVVGRPLYENRFPCQRTWCWNYPEEVALDEFTTARLRPAEASGCRPEE